jgi:hypothetical protein
MEYVRIREYFVDFYGEGSKEVLCLDGLSNETNINMIYTYIKENIPEVEHLDEVILDIEKEIYKSIILDKRIVNNNMPCINIIGEDGNIESLYKELHDKLESVDNENYTIEYVLESVFTYFVTKYNEIVKSHNEFVNMYKIFLEELKKPLFNKGKIYEEMKTDITNKETKQEFVYIASGSKTFYKIGRTKSISEREKALRTGNHVLKMFAYTMTYNPIKLESLLHEIYKHKNVGGEWFDFTKEEVNELISSFGFSVAIEKGDA